MTTDEIYMTRCIQLAKNGAEQAPPNPMVGAVIVHEGRIIGEGYHVRCGEAHAEVNAINSVKDKVLLKNSTIYVSLEPCSHYGKTPPCADLIISTQIPRVVVGCTDPFDKVSGRGIQKLKDAGIDVQTGVLEEDCRDLIKKFTTFNLKHRPYITLKWAESADGFIDACREGGKPTILSTPLTSMIVHKRRAETDSIMIGTNTARLDNPSLTTRNWHGANPTRIVLDRNLRLPLSLRLFDNTVETIVFAASKRENSHATEYITIDYHEDIIPQVLTTLHNRNIQTLLIEGGNMLLQSFINSNTWDEAFVEKSPLLLGSGIAAPKIKKADKHEDKIYFNRCISHYTNSTDL